MATYYLYTDDGSESQIEARSDREAIRLASEAIRSDWEPEGASTYFVHVILRDEDDIRVADWTEAIDPEVPDCDPPIPELEDASPDDLAAVWDAEIEDEDEHVWARPHRLLGGLEHNPGVQLIGAGVVIQQVCLRCGTLSTVDTDATDRSSGRQGLESIEYDPGRYAAEVEEAWIQAQQRWA